MKKLLHNRVIAAISTVVGETALRADCAIIRMGVRNPGGKLLFEFEPRVPEHPYNVRAVWVRVGFNVLARLDSLRNGGCYHFTHRRYTAPKARSDNQTGARLPSECSDVKKTTGQTPGYSAMCCIPTGSRIIAVHHAMICSLRSFTSILLTLLEITSNSTRKYLRLSEFVTVGNKPTTGA